MKRATPDEGQAAFDRFRRAMKTIVTVPKDAALESPKKRTQPRNRAKREL